VRRAAAVHPITALQSDWSLWSRDLESGALAAARELGIGIVPYSPLGRGFLSGQIRTNADFPEGDLRRNMPRFNDENFDRNLALVDAVQDIARDKGVTPAQLALAWVLSRGDDVVPIPGTKRRTYLDENLAALDVVLGADELAAIEKVFPPDAAVGHRYAAAVLATGGDTPTRA
jgi:aryl-alcohol dehydrogenase-like predicted oxidoreductase